MTLVITLVIYTEGSLELLEFRADQLSELYVPRGVEGKIIICGLSLLLARKLPLNSDHWIKQQVS